MTTEIYLDGNATSAVMPAAITAAVAAMEDLFGNPSSTHAAGLRANDLLDTVRSCARRVLGAGDGRLMFNSGATEGIQTAMLSALLALRERRAAGLPIGAVLVYGATEHKAVPESMAHWNGVLGLNLPIRVLPVDADGQHDLAALREMAPQAALVCTMAANNETGVVSDLAAIEAVLGDSGSAAVWLVDCVQALGKLPLDLARSRIDYAPFSGHKLYAPKGIGMLYVRAGAPFTPLMMGGGQESGQRSGTENMAGIAALGAVLAALEQGATFHGHAGLVALRDRLVASLRDALPGVVMNTPLDKSLATTLNFSVPGLSSKQLLDVFDAAGIRISSGSACSAAKAAPSHVLEAMALPSWRSGAAIRLSFGPLIDSCAIDAACARIAHCGQALRTSGWRADGTGAAAAGNDVSLPLADLAAAVTVNLEWPALAGFLAAQPAALLIDVREPCECLAGPVAALGGRPVQCVPLGALAGATAAWLEAGVPLVFLCRSGKRSARAAAFMRAAGHAAAWSLGGGLALASGAS